MTDCGVRGLGFKSPGSILTSRTETSSLSRVVRDGWDPCYVPLKWVKKKSPAVESSTWPLNSHNCSENYTKKNTSPAFHQYRAEGIGYPRLQFLTGLLCECADERRWLWSKCSRCAVQTGEGVDERTKCSRCAVQAGEIGRAHV